MFHTSPNPLVSLRLKRSDSSPAFSRDEQYQRIPSPDATVNPHMDLSSSLSGSIKSNRLSLDDVALNNANSETANISLKSSSSSGSGNHQAAPIPFPRSQNSQKKTLRHQRSLNEENGPCENVSREKNYVGYHATTTKQSSFQHLSAAARGENDGPGGEFESTSTLAATVEENQPIQPRGGGLNHSNSGGGLHKSNLSISDPYENNNNLNTTLSQNFSNQISPNQRPPAIRSNSSSSSLFPLSTLSNKEISKERPVSGSESRSRSRRGAMVSCDNLLAESSELFNSVQENTFKSGKSGSRKMYRSGAGIFTNPFKSDSEKMEQLNELLRQYRENGIPDSKCLQNGGGVGGGINSKLCHFRASSLSISGIGSANSTVNCAAPSSSSSSSQLTSLLATNKTSLSTTDLHHLNHSNNTTTLGLANNNQTTGSHCVPFFSSSPSSFDTSCDSSYYLESKWRVIVENSDQLPERIQSQNEAIWELLQTEVFYIRRLKVINDVFIACLLNLQNECLLTEIDPKNLFSNIGEVFEANHHFWMSYLLPMLNYSRETKRPLNPIMLEEGFLQFDQIFRPYIQYFLEQNNCVQYYKEKRKSNALFKTYITWCENHKDCERLRLLDLLVKPIQRLTKYSLLLKAILKKTDDELHRESLKKMDLSVERYVISVNAAMSRQQEIDRLVAVVSRIDHYDAVDCNNDEAEKILRDYLFLDLTQSMPGCSSHRIRHLYLEDSLKLKDAQSNKIDVHCLLFTDIFLVCKALKKSSDSKMKVIRQPLLTDRLVVRELKDGSGFLMIYLNELNVACTFLLLYTPETRIWVDTIRKAQEDYRSLKDSSEHEYSTYQAHFDEDDTLEGNAHCLLGTASPRSSSRSSLIHSHSGSQDLSDQPMTIQSQCHANSQVNTNQLAIQAQPPRAVSFELGDLRNPSLVVEDTESFARSNSVDNRSPVVTDISPRQERRAFLFRNNGKNTSGNVSSGGSSPSDSISHVSQNSLSVNVPCFQQNFLPVQVHSQPLVHKQTYQHAHQQVIQQPQPQPQPFPRAGRRSGVPNPSSIQSAAFDSGYPNNYAVEQIASPLNQHTSTIQVSVHPPPTPPSPPPLPSTSPKRSTGQRLGRFGTSQASLTGNSHSPPPPPPPPPSLMSISSRGQPTLLTMTVNKPPLVKTKNISCGVASLSCSTEHTPVNSTGSSGEFCISDSSSSGNTLLGDIEEIHDEGKLDRYDDFTKNCCGQQLKRTCRPDRRYHTADSIEHMKQQEKDNSIHKRLSWNYGQQHLCPHQHSCDHFSLPSPVACSSVTHLQPQQVNQCVSNESVYSGSSGFSSTGSVPFSVGSHEHNYEHGCCQKLLNAHNEIKDDKESLVNQMTSCIANELKDRDTSIMPISHSTSAHAASSTRPVCYHAHSNSQCSMDSYSSHENSHSFSNSSSAQASFDRVNSRPPPLTNSDIQIDENEIKYGISSIQITPSGGTNTVIRPSKADLKKMKEFLLSNCNVESSEV